MIQIRGTVWKESDGFISASEPFEGFPTGVASQGDTEEEAREMLQDAIATHLNVEIKEVQITFVKRAGANLVGFDEED